MFRFIQEVAFTNKPFVFLFTDQHTADLGQFCSDQDRFTVFSIDTALNMGDFNVTVCTYGNLASYRDPQIN